jgi:hypothetical protein
MNKVKIIMSPFKGMNGEYHTLEYEVEEGKYLHEIFQDWDLNAVNIAVNGTSIEEKALYLPSANSEIIVSGQIGIPFLIVIAISIIISVVLSVVMMLLFPVKPPKFEPPEKEGSSFSWSGIQTTQGPGNVVPIIYGRHRVGGQLLTAYVEERTNNQEFTIQDPVLNMLISVGEGEIEEFEMDTVEINDQPISNYQEISLDSRLGTPNQTPIPFFTQSKNTFDQGNIDFSENPVTYTTLAAINGFIIHVDFAAGLYHIDAKSGVRANNTSTWQYRYRLNVGPGSWSAPQRISTSTDQKKTVHRPIKVENLPLAVYDIEISHVSATFTDDQSEFKPYLTKISEIVDVTEAFPNTALYGLRVVATENLQGSLPNATVIIKGTKVRVGSFLNTPIYSENPSWCLMDFMTNVRYGLGLPDEEIDLASFIAFASYCDEFVDVDEDHDGIADAQEKRAIISYVIDTDADAPQVIDEILMPTRAVLVKTEGLWKVKIAQDSVPVQLITWASTIRDSVILTYIRDSEATNVLECRFSNSNDDYEQDVLVYPRVEDWPYQVNKSSLEFRSAARPTQIERETAFNLVSRRYQKQAIEFEMNIAGMIFEIMDVIRFSHPLPGYGWSGRVVENYGATVTNTREIVLDSEVPFAPGGIYHVFLQNKDDVQNVRLLVNPASTQTVNTRVLQLDAAEPDLTFVPSEGYTQWAFGKAEPFNTAYKLFRITKVERAGDFIISVTGVEHNPTIFDPFTAELLPSPSHLIKPDGPPPPLIQLVGFEEIFRDATGNLNNFIVLEWDVMQVEEARRVNPRIKYGVYGGGLVYRRYVEGSAVAGSLLVGEFLAAEAGSQDFDNLSGFNLVGSVTGQYAFQYKELAPPVGTIIQYRVVPISVRGTPNYDGLLQVEITVTNIDVTPPAASVGLVAEGGIRAIELSWSNPTVLDFDGVEIWASKINNRAAATKVGSVFNGGVTFSHTGLGNLETWYYWIRSFDYAGNFSPFHPESPTAGVSATTLDGFGDNLRLSGNYLYANNVPYNASGVHVGEIYIADAMAIATITAEFAVANEPNELAVTYFYDGQEHWIYLLDEPDAEGSRYGAQGNNAVVYNTKTRMMGAIAANTTIPIKLYNIEDSNTSTVTWVRVMIYGFSAGT